MFNWAKCYSVLKPSLIQNSSCHLCLGINYSGISQEQDHEYRVVGESTSSSLLLCLLKRMCKFLSNQNDFCSLNIINSKR